MGAQPAHETRSGIPRGESLEGDASPSQGRLGILKGVGVNPFGNTFKGVLK